MNCYDCAVEGRAEPAVGICIKCGAGICRRHLHLQVEQGEVEPGSIGPGVEEATRRLLCTSCDQVLVNRQPDPVSTQRKRSLTDLASSTKSTLGKQGAAMVQRMRADASTPKTRQELYEEARRRGLKGRSKMSRDQLARALGHT
jgi:hypothetical protein